MEIINDIISQPFTSEDEMRAISIESNERRRVEKKQYIRACCSDILSAQCSCPTEVVPERETITREKYEIVSTTPFAAPERVFKPRVKRGIF
jgi:hypothetical protein